MNTRQCPQNPFDQINRPSGPDMAVGIPGNQSEQGNLKSEMGNVSFETESDYCPWSIIDAFTKTMWEWWNYTSKAYNMRI
eukprot:2638922-Heterocapsa_arctica.AAC.1